MRRFVLNSSNSYFQQSVYRGKLGLVMTTCYCLILCELYYSFFCNHPDEVINDCICIIPIRIHFFIVAIGKSLW